MGHIIPFKGRNKSSVHNLNLLFNSGKYFLMDNHLAASWCWSQVLDFNEKYNLFHIDRHYDLMDSKTDIWIKELKNNSFDFRASSIDDLLEIKYDFESITGDKKVQLFRYDNYIPIFYNIYPHIFNDLIFATHKDGTIMKDLEIVNKDIFEIPENLEFWINECGNGKKWIINLDMDYFFCDYKENYIQFLTDDYIKSLANKIKIAWDNIEVLTIALSPEFCNWWDEAERIAKIITDILELEWYE